MQYELLDGSNFTYIVEEDGNPITLSGGLQGSCSIALRQADVNTDLHLQDIHFLSASEPKVAVSGDGIWTIQFGSLPIVRGGLQYAEVSLTVNDKNGLGAGSIESRITPRYFPVLVETLAGRPFGMTVILAPTQADAKRFFRRGDTNGDGERNLTDPILVLERLFRSGPELVCFDASDSNDDGKVDLADATYLLSHLFIGQRLPPLPTRLCGVDPTEDSLDCQGQPACTPES